MFDRITITLSYDRVTFVEPTDSEDTGLRLENAYFRQAVQSLTELVVKPSQVNSALLHKQLDGLINNYENIPEEYQGD